MRRVRARAVVLCLLLPLVAVSTATGAEKTDTRALTSAQAKIVTDYINRSTASLERLEDILDQGKTGARRLWESECKQTMRLLTALDTRGWITDDIHDWFEDENAAWERMLVVGREIAEANEKILDSTNQLEYSVRISKDELRAVTTDIRENVQKALNPLMAEAGELAEAAGRLKTALEAISGDSDVSDMTAVLDGFDAVNEQLGDLDGKVTTVERLEIHIRRIGDSIRRRKDESLQASVRDLEQHRRNLAKLVSARIDPDGRGAFSAKERKIEALAQASLKEYFAAVKEWKEVNDPLLQNAKAFGNEFIVPEVDKLVREKLPTAIFGFAVPKWALRPDEALHEAADSFRDWSRTAWERWVSGTYWERISLTITTWEEELDIMASQHEVALAVKDRELASQVATLEDRSHEVVKEFEAQIKAKRAELDDLPPGDRNERRRVEDEIEDLEREREAEKEALESQIEDLTDEVAGEKKTLTEEFEEKYEELEKRLVEIRKLPDSA